MNEGDFDGLVDPKLHQNYNADEMNRMVACAAACVRHSAWLRPRMSQVTIKIFISFYPSNIYFYTRNLNLSLCFAPKKI